VGSGHHVYSHVLRLGLHTDLALDALEMGIWTRKRAGRDLSQLIKGIDDLEFAVAEYIDWHNNRRLHGELDHIPPTEKGQHFYSNLSTITQMERV
jgi:transposase InsO family protein